MKITEFHWERYSFPFRKPFKNSGYTYREKAGFYLFVEFDYTKTFSGECAPLPGVNEESTGDVALELEQLESALMFQNFDSIEELKNMISNLTQSASIRFGFAQIIDGLEFGDSQGLVRLQQNSVISALSPELLKTGFEYSVAAGFTTIKLKVGVLHPEDEAALIRNLSETYPNIKIRLDANSIFDYDEASRFIESLQNCNIEYFEDPVSQPEEMYRLSKNSNIPVAADIFTNSFDNLHQIYNESLIRHFVLKPMAFRDILFLNDRKLPDDIHLIFSSSFESFVGRIYNYLLASKFHETHGLATAGILDERISDKPFDESRAVVSFDRKVVSDWLNEKVLI